MTLHYQYYQYYPVRLKKTTFFEYFSSSVIQIFLCIVDNCLEMYYRVFDTIVIMGNVSYCRMVSYCNLLCGSHYFLIFINTALGHHNGHEISFAAEISKLVIN